MATEDDGVRLEDISTFIAVIGLHLRMLDREAQIYGAAVKAIAQYPMIEPEKAAADMMQIAERALRELKRRE